MIKNCTVAVQKTNYYETIMNNKLVLYPEVLWRNQELKRFGNILSKDDNFWGVSRPTEKIQFAGTALTKISCSSTALKHFKE